jgi:hypothetical protein
MAKRIYKGCELSSPLYRKIVAQMAKKKNIILEQQPYKKKNVTS